jgi:hypothetical protein
MAHCLSSFQESLSFSDFNADVRQHCRLQPPAHTGSSLADFSTLNMETICSSETSVHTRSTRRHIPDDGVLKI